jgi:hypothetical protein
MDRRGKTASLQFYVEGGVGMVHQCGFGALAVVNGQNVGLPMNGNRDIQVRSGEWTRLTYTFNEGQASSLFYLFVDCLMGVGGTPWNGAAYIDDEVIE